MRRSPAYLAMLVAAASASARADRTAGVLTAKPPPVTRDPDVCRTLDKSTRTVKVVSAGTGKRSLLRYAFHRGAHQSIDITLDLTSIGIDPPVAGPPPEDHQPTFVLAGDVVIQSVDASGNAEIVMTMRSAKARGGDPGEAESFAPMIEMLEHMTVTGTVGPDGSASLKACAPGDAIGALALDFVRGRWPAWPLLPASPVGSGAIWEVARTDRVTAFDAVETTRFELSTRTPDRWTASGAIRMELKGKHDPIDHFETTGKLDASADAKQVLPSLQYERTIKFSAKGAQFGFIEAAQILVH
jgi:hypothetical protein